MVSFGFLLSMPGGVPTSKRLTSVVENGTRALEVFKLEENNDLDAALNNLATNLSRLIADHVHSLVTQEKESRLAGVAFVHTALTVLEIKNAVKERWLKHHAVAEKRLIEFGSSDPGLMANMLIGIIDHTERRCHLGVGEIKVKAYLDKTMFDFFKQVLKTC